MVDLYVSPSCTSCRKARAWLEKHDIPFKERNIFSEPLTKKEILKILRMTRCFLPRKVRRLELAEAQKIADL